MKTLRGGVWLLVLCVAALSLFATSTYAQDSDRTQIIRINTNGHPRIEIVVGVLDKAGRPLVGLKQENFKVLENGTGMPIVSVTGLTDESIPLSIVLVIDTSTSMTGRPLAKAKEAATAFVDKVRDIDELALVTFDSTVREVQPMTKDKALIKKKIGELTAQGQTALYDAITQAVKTAQTGTSKRRAIVLLSDGNEYGGHSKSSSKDGFTQADKAGIPIFTIALGWGDRGIRDDYLKQVAAGAGGSFFLSPQPEDLVKVYGQIGTVLRSLYVITVDTTLPAEGTTQRIRVEFVKDSDSGFAEANARYPAPIPVIKFGGLDPNTPLRQPTVVTPNIVADDKILGYEYAIDGKQAVSATGDAKPLTIDPLKLTPGKHTLALTVRDDKAPDVGRATLDFQVAALPPEFTIDGLKDRDTLSADRSVTLTVDASQTPIESVTFDVDGKSPATLTAAPFRFDIRVLDLEPGKHTLTAQAKNKDATGNKSVDFMVSPGPRQTATAAANMTATRNAAATLTAMPTQTPTPTFTSTPTNTLMPSSTPTSTSTPQPTATLTSTAVPATDTPAATTTPRPSDTPAAAAQVPTNTPVPTDTDTPVPPTVTSTPVPPTNTPVPPTDTPAPTNTSTPTPTATPVPPAGALETLTSNPLLCGGGILLLLIVIIMVLLSGSRRSAARRPGP